MDKDAARRNKAIEALKAVHDAKVVGLESLQEIVISSSLTRRDRKGSK